MHQTGQIISNILSDLPYPLPSHLHVDTCFLVHHVLPLPAAYLHHSILFFFFFLIRFVLYLTNSVFKGNYFLGEYAGGGGLLISNNFGVAANNITVNRCIFSGNSLGPGSTGNNV